jgi:hypothetical protein
MDSSIPKDSVTQSRKFSSNLVWKEIQHIPSDDTKSNFLNFDERMSVSKALQKLVNYSDVISNLSSVFKVNQ